MARRRKLLCASALLLLVGLGVLAGLEGCAHRTPLSVGATADEAWRYLHSSAAWGSRGPLFELRRLGPTGHALDIQCDVRCFWRWPTNRLFAVRHDSYVLNTNGTIVSIKSGWKWVRPF